METIRIYVSKNVATCARGTPIVCDNTDYQIEFIFDEEWEAYPNKTARFIWNDQYFDVEFAGHTCMMPPVCGTEYCTVGVYAEGLQTTTGAKIRCRQSVLDLADEPTPGYIEHNISEAEQYAKEAKESAADAATFAETAESHADDAKESAESAETSVSDAKAHAEAASESANRAEASASTAAESAAAAFATEAEKYVADAKSHADDSAASAERAEASVSTAETKAAESATNAVKPLLNNVSNAIKGSASGEAVVLNDVSPIEHELGVSVSSKNVFHFTKNLNTTSNGLKITTNANSSSFTVDGTSTNTSFSGYSFTSASMLLPAGTYTLNISDVPFAGKEGNDRIQINGKNPLTGSAEMLVAIFFNNQQKKPTFTITETLEIYVNFLFTPGRTWENQEFTVHVEEGTTASAPTPYIDDISAVTVSAAGKNLFTFDNVTFATNNADYVSCETGEGWMKQTFSKDVTGNSYQSVSFIFHPPKEMLNKPLIFSADFESDIEKNAYVQIRNSQTAAVQNKWGTTPQKDKIAYEIRFDGVEGDQFNIYFNLSGSADVQITQGQYYKYSNVQIEPVTAANSAATAYEPYIEPVTYPVSADGMVQGVAPIYPNTTLLTDTAGAIIDCEYNRDLNKAFQELQQAILTLGV